MLPRSQELLNVHSSGCICAYAVSLAITVKMGNSVVPSVARRENKEKIKLSTQPENLEGTPTARQGTAAIYLC